VLAFFVITDRWYIAYEEKMLTAKFGNLFEVYKMRTRRWI
jgi:protein-S-isoprenylcysteine O-methyltransferase Ste14